MRHLPVELTDDERLDLSIELSEKLNELEEIEAEKKEANATFKLKTDALESQVSRLGKSVRTGTEEREVECRWVHHSPVRGMKSLIRLDRQGDSAVVEEREMTDYDRAQAALELQLPMFTPSDSGQ